MSAAAAAGSMGMDKNGRVAFDLSKEYDTSSYNGRFLQQVNLVNPLRFFTPKKRILEAKDEVNAYKKKQEEDGEVWLNK